MSVADELSQRFFDQLVGVNPNKKRLDYQISTGQVQAKRTLLAVEAQAQKLREAGAMAKAQFTEFAQAQLHDELADDLLLTLHNISKVSALLFDPGQNFYALLDLLVDKRVTVGSLEEPIAAVKWLEDELIRLSHQPQYRPRSGGSGGMNDIKIAIRLIGINKLPFLIPVYAMRKMQPHSTEPFISLKNQIWTYTLSVANASRVLAENSAEDPYKAFCVGLFHSLGHIVVIRSYLRAYQAVKQRLLLKARDNRDTALNDALSQLEADGGFLCNTLYEFAATLSADITSRWQLTALPLCQTLDQIAEGAGFSGSSPLARLVLQAQTFVQWQALHTKKAISDDETKRWFAAVQLNTENIDLLNRADLKQLSFDN